jgi:hypothetical protein
MGEIGIPGVHPRISVGTLRDFAPLGGQPMQTGRMVEGFAHFDGRTARFPAVPQRTDRAAPGRNTRNAWRSRRRQWVKADKMRGKSLGECGGKGDAFARSRLRIKHDQQIFVAH